MLNKHIFKVLFYYFCTEKCTRKLNISTFSPPKIEKTEMTPPTIRYGRVWPKHHFVDQKREILVQNGHKLVQAGDILLFSRAIIKHSLVNFSWRYRKKSKDIFKMSFLAQETAFLAQNMSFWFKQRRRFKFAPQKIRHFSTFIPQNHRK